MEPVGLRIEYRVCPGHPREVTDDSQGGDPDDADVLVETFVFADSFAGEIARVDFDGEILEVSVETAVSLKMESFQVTLRHAFSGDEKVLLNGYQSWTDTAERSAWSHMRGLSGIWARLSSGRSLGASGDYAFVDYAEKRGLQHGFSYATFRRGDGMVLVASLDETNGFTLISIDATKGQVTLETECPANPLPKGRRFVLGRYAIVRGTMRRCYDRWFELMGIRARSVRPLVGYTSWYRHYSAIDEAILDRDVAGTASFFSRFAPESASSALKVFQIDDGYCKVGDWLDVDAAKFPRGLKPLVARIREAGFVPGLWLAPFVCERDSRLFREKPEWLLRDASGDPIATGGHWSGGYALDTRNVEVRSYVLETLQVMTREWGFGLLKADFLYGACMIPHAGLNRGQLMADAVDLLRKGAGDDVLILGCGVPLASAFGKVDYCRIGCDVGLDWNGLPHMRMLHRERVSTKNSLGNTYARAPLNGRAFGNDPDVFFLRDDVHLSDAQRDELLFANADLGYVLLTSDDMTKWGRAMRERYSLAVDMLVQRCGQAR